jgi:hypothetical protein
VHEEISKKTKLRRGVNFNTITTIEKKNDISKKKGFINAFKINLKH